MEINEIKSIFKDYIACSNNIKNGNCKYTTTKCQFCTHNFNANEMLKAVEIIEKRLEEITLPHCKNYCKNFIKCVTIASFNNEVFIEKENPKSCIGFELRDDICLVKNITML